MKKLLVLSICISMVILSIFKFPVYATAGQWSTNGSNFYYNDGNLGLGTSTPLSRLQVQGVNESIGIGGALNSSQNTGLQFIDTGVQHAGLRWSNNGSKNLYLEDASNSGNPSTWNIANNQVNFVVGNGNVGIGRSNSTNALHVARDGTLNLEGYTSATSYIQFYPKSLASGRYGWLGYGSLTDNNLSVANAQGGIVLQPSPTSFVYVDGTIRTRELDVMTNIWADYVFNKDYKLMKLNDVSSYIKENNHLPNIPSEKEIKDKGISIGDMQAKQMAKIEELTLYMINQDKRLNDLEKQNDLLKQEIKLIQK